MKRGKADLESAECGRIGGTNTETGLESPTPRPRGRSRRRTGKGNEEVRFGAWSIRTMVYKAKLKRGELDVSGGGLGKEEPLGKEPEGRKQRFAEYRSTGGQEKAKNNMETTRFFLADQTKT